MVTVTETTKRKWGKNRKESETGTTETEPGMGAETETEPKTGTETDIEAYAKKETEQVKR